MGISITYRKNTDIVRDPIYNYIGFTKPSEHGEVTEKDIIDSRLLQRLRCIHQLQSAWIVYPGAEHTRFQHSLGTMHLSGIFANNLFSPYHQQIGQSIKLPEINSLVEEFRIAGLLHDVGHGPFGHLLDDIFLYPNYKITHEDLSQTIIKNEFTDIISKIKRSPYGLFKEDLDVNRIANLVKFGNEDFFNDNYQKSLYKILHGIWSADTLDFIQRDAYYCGTREYGMIDYERLIYSSIMPETGGLALYKTSEQALQSFILSRIFMFTSVYFHRTARAFDTSVKKLLPQTMELLNIGNPIKEGYHNYIALNEFSLFSIVKSWAQSANNGGMKKLGESWMNVLNRKLEWKHVYSEDIHPFNILGEESLPNEEKILEVLQTKLPKNIDISDIDIDIPSLDIRSPFSIKNMDYAVYDPDEEKIIDQKGMNHIMMDLLPKKMVYFSVYAKKEKRKEIYESLKKASKDMPIIKQITNY